MTDRLYRYESPRGPLYGLSWSSRNDKGLRLLTSSFLSTSQNYISLLALDSAGGALKEVGSTDVVYPCTKLQFLPSMDNSNPDLFVTSSDCLRLYEIRSSQIMCRGSMLPRATEYVPMLSLDWCAHSLNLIVTANMDSTVTLWDIYKQAQEFSFVAHEGSVNDVNFSFKDPYIFATCGSDGKVRIIDRRKMHLTTEIYAASAPVLRCEFSHAEANYLACVVHDSNDVVILDMRSPGRQLLLRAHSGPVNSVSWSPNSGDYLLTVAEDREALIWDSSKLGDAPPSDQPVVCKDPAMGYGARSSLAGISNCRWNWLSQEWVSIVQGQLVEILHL